VTVLLDTHAAIWFASEDAALGKRSRTLSNEALAEGRLCISPISFWEIALLVEKGRLEAGAPASELRSLLLDAGVVELALTGDIALLSATLDLHGDPADRFIAATAITHRATLLTADARLLDSKHAVKRQNARK
jgi:PIN domain nuclease of toxin-antitoxin system